MTQATLTKNTRVSTAGLTALLGLLTAFAPFSTDMYLAAFPAMARDLGTDVGRIQLTLSVFFFGLAIGQLAYGPLSDRFGRRRPLLVGLSIYIAASIGLAMVRNIEWFLLLRFVQAIGGCAGMIISRAVIRDLFDLEGSARVLTLMMAVQSIGPVAAPVIGGYLLGLTSWTSIFILLTLFGVGCLAAAFFTLPESLPAENRLRQTTGEIGGVFVHLLRKRDFITPALAGALGGAAIFAFISGSPFVLMDLYGFNETQYGWAFGLFCLGTALMSQSNFLLLRKFSARLVLMIGLSFTAVFGAALAFVVSFDGQADLAVLLALLFLSLWTIPVIAANSTAVAMAFSGSCTGSGSSLIGMLQFSLAGLISSITSLLHDGSAWPMSFMIMVCGLAALAVMAWGRVTKGAASV